MKKLVLLFLAALAPVRALSVFADGIGIDPGFLTQDTVLVANTGVLTLQKPGTYIATSWSITGVVRLGAPGTYNVVASSGAIVFNPGSILRAPGGDSAVKVTFVAPGGFQMSGTTDGPVTVAQGLPTTDASPPPLINLSTRATLSPGQILTTGFTLNGTTPRRVLIRAVGPTLSTFGIANAVSAPEITVLNGKTIVGANFGWSGDSALSAAFSTVGAFPFASSSRDAAILLTLAPGAYTVQVSGGSSSTASGDILAEIYLVETTSSGTQGAGGG